MSPQQEQSALQRREFLKVSAATVGAIGAGGMEMSRLGAAPADESHGQPQPTAGGAKRTYNAEYTGEHLNRIAFPLGGIGAGMICLEGSGAVSHFSLRNRPEVFNEPCTFAAICVLGEKNVARVLQGPVPGWKLFGPPERATAPAARVSGCLGSIPPDLRPVFRWPPLNWPTPRCRWTSRRRPESIRARRCRQLQSARGRAGISVYQSFPGGGAGRVFLQCPEFHGDGFQSAGREGDPRWFRALGWRRPRKTLGRRDVFRHGERAGAKVNLAPGSAAVGSMP